MKVLVADDSILFRRVMAEVLASLPDVEVVGQAPNGKLAVQKVRELRPDLLTLDMEMPEMDGLAVLDALKQAGDAPAVIVVSALTRQGGQLTMQALQKGRLRLHHQTGHGQRRAEPRGPARRTGAARQGPGPSPGGPRHPARGIRCRAQGPPGSGRCAPPIGSLHRPWTTSARRMTRLAGPQRRRWC